MKSLLTTQWNFFRIIRLILGVAVIIQGVNSSAALLVFVGGIVSVMALLNVGCCGNSGCSLPANRNKKTVRGDIV